MRIFVYYFQIIHGSLGEYFSWNDTGFSIKSIYLYIIHIKIRKPIHINKMMVMQRLLQ